MEYELPLLCIGRNLQNHMCKPLIKIININLTILILLIYRFYFTFRSSDDFYIKK